MLKEALEKVMKDMRANINQCERLPGVTIRDLDKDEIRLAVDSAVQAGRLDQPRKRGIEIQAQAIKIGLSSRYWG